MKLAVAQPGILLVLAVLPQSCGGGSSDGDGPGSGSNTRLTISATNVSVAATPGETTPVRTVTLNVTNPPTAGLFVEGAYSALGIETLDFVGNSATQGTLTINFRSPGSLQNGTYSDSIQLRVCTEQPCVTQISGSPATVSTSYVVSGTGTSTVTLDRNSVEVATDTSDEFARAETVRLTLSVAPASAIHVQTNHTSNAVQSAYYRTLSNTLTEVDIRFLSGQQLAPRQLQRHCRDHGLLRLELRAAGAGQPVHGIRVDRRGGGNGTGCHAPRGREPRGAAAQHH